MNTLFHQQYLEGKLQTTTLAQLSVQTPVSFTWKVRSKFMLTFSSTKDLPNRTRSRLVLRIHEQLQRSRLRVQWHRNEACWPSTVCSNNQCVYVTPCEPEREIKSVRSSRKEAQRPVGWYALFEEFWRSKWNPSWTKNRNKVKRLHVRVENWDQKSLSNLEE